MRYAMAYGNLRDMSNSSRTYQLIETKLGKSLVEHARSMRGEGASWHTISIDLASQTGVAVTPETLRIWLAGEDGMERSKATEAGVA